VEIACDESGSEGEKLIGATTDVFAHASVRMDAESAMSCIQEIRDRAPSRALEYKAYHILRGRNRPALAWFLGPSGPLYGNAHVHLTDKAFFVVGKVVDLIADGDRAGPMAVTLYREGRRTFDSDLWQSFLGSANNFMRATNRRGEDLPTDSFFLAVDSMRRREVPARVDEILSLLARAKPHVDSVRARLLDGQKSALDPLIPAIIRAIVHWGEGCIPVSIVHDRQNALSEDLVAQLKETFGKPTDCGVLADLSLVDSRADTRIQVADVLAGAARKIASDELNNRGDPELTALLRPYVDKLSVWGDARSWSVLAPSPDH
jgi:hypothetical protein